MARPQRREKGTSLRDLVPGDLFVQHIQAGTKREAIAELVNSLAIQGVIDLAQEREVREAILQREAVASTGIGNGLAIPHHKLRHAGRFGIVFGLSEAGIDWAAHDGQPVRVAVCWVCPTAETKEHLALMRGLAAAAKDPGNVDRLARCRDRRQLLNALLEIEVEPKGR